MAQDKSFSDHPIPLSPVNNENHFLANNMVAVYTVLSILVKMQHVLGLEAMLEYIRSYLNIIEKYNPQIKPAVSQAMQLISVAKIYKEAVYGEKT